MILYHVSADIHSITKEFIPRIPNIENLAINEDNIIPRICVSPSINQCITAVPNWGGSQFTEDMVSPLIDICKLIRIYEFDINIEDELSKGNIIIPYTLKKNDWVFDAMITGEHWILKPIKPTKTYLINITRYEESLEDIYSADIQLRLNDENDDCGDIDFEDELETTITAFPIINYKIINNDLITHHYYREFLIDSNYVKEIHSILNDLEDENVYVQHSIYTINNILCVNIPAHNMQYTHDNIDKILEYVLQQYII